MDRSLGGTSAPADGRSSSPLRSSARVRLPLLVLFATTACEASALEVHLELQGECDATALATVEVVRSGRLVDGVKLSGQLDAALASELADLAPGEYVYVRVAQTDGGMAWSSPIYVGDAP